MNLIFYKPPYASYTYFIHDSYEFGIGSAMFANPLCSSAISAVPPTIPPFQLRLLAASCLVAVICFDTTYHVIHGTSNILIYCVKTYHACHL